MSAVRVPWRRSLFLRLFAIAALVAVVAVGAATWATVRSTAVAVRQEQRQSLHAEARAYDELLGYAATHRSWGAAGPLVDSLAAESGSRISVTDRAGRVLVDSAGAEGSLPVTEARAEIDALDVDPLLVDDGEGEPSNVPSEQPVVATGEPAAACPLGAAGCGRFVVGAATVVDPRVEGGLPPERVTPVLRRVGAATDACLRRAGLEPLVALDPSLAAVVGTPERHAVVARCLRRAERSVLGPLVAPPALLFVAGPPSSADVFWDFSGRQQWRIGLLAGAVLAVTLVACAALAAHVARPLRRMADAALRASDGDLAVRVPDRRGDEVGEVARAFNRLAERRQQLEEARRRLVSDVSHELRTPLANVRGWVEAAQDGLVEADDRLLGSLHEETVQLQALVDDLHQLALGDAGELRLRPERLDLEAVLQQVAVSFRAAADAAGVVVRAEVTPGATVLADPTRLRQALANLVGNAVRHTPAEGLVTLRGAPGVVQVVDTGEGIPAEELPHVFERFRRVDASRSRATGGSGLGLAVVRQVVEAHGGEVTIASVPGAGTTVTLRLPDRARDQGHSSA